MTHMKAYNKFCLKIYETHPQGRGILTFKFFEEKFRDELQEGFLWSK